MGRSIWVIVNPVAGKPEPVLAVLDRVFRSSDSTWQVHATRGRGDARRLAEAAARAGVDLVAAYGGDGTVTEAASGLLGSNVPLGILPGGTGNLLAVELGIPRDLEQAATLLAGQAGQVRPLDVGQLAESRDGRPFLIRVSAGLEAAAVHGAQRLRKDRFGPLAYWIGAAHALREAAVSRYQLRLDGQQVVETEGVLCAINNAGNLGAQALQLAPDIRPDDGWLDVVVWRSADPGSLAGLAASMATGTERAPALEHWRARAVDVEADPPQPVQVDGESSGSTPVHARLQPGAIRVVVPR